MSIGKNIRALREAHGLNQTELAKIAGVTDKAVSTWENDLKTPRMTALAKLAEHFGIPKSAIIEDGALRIPAAYVRIPVVGAVKAGIPTEAVEDIVDWEDIPAEQACRGDYIGLQVRGQSMEPRICDGDTVIVRRQNTVENGELAVVFVNGDEATLKRVKFVDGGMMLIAFNPAVYEPHFYSAREIAELPVSIYGKVVELRGKF